MGNGTGVRTMPTLKTAHVNGITYAQKMIRCGKSACRRCPHGPYWYAFWDEAGITKSEYVGKSLPPGILPVDPPPPPPPAARVVTLRQAKKALALNGTEPYERAFKRYRVRRQFQVDQGVAGRPGVVLLDESWRVVCEAWGWI